MIIKGRGEGATEIIVSTFVGSFVGSRLGRDVKDAVMHQPYPDYFTSSSCSELEPRARRIDRDGSPCNRCRPKPPPPLDDRRQRAADFRYQIWRPCQIENSVVKYITGP